MYRHLDAALLRAAVAPVTATPPWPDLTADSDDQVRQWRAWLTAVWTPEFAEAVTIASPVLARDIEKVRVGDESQPREVRGIGLSTARYLLRATTRATPFGLFAGIAPIRFDASATSLRWGPHHTAVVRPGPDWLAALVSHLEACDPLLDRLRIAVNNLCAVRGDQLVVPFQPGPDGTPVEVSVRHSRAVAVTVSLARNRPFADLVAKLAVEFPDRDTQLRAMLRELLRQRVLLTDLRPPMRATDPLGHIITRLAAAEADTIPELTQTLTALRALHDNLHPHHTTADVAQRERIRASATTAMGDITGQGSPSLAVDLRLDCAATLPPAVARRAEQAAAILTRLDPTPRGEATWRDYHSRFLDRYGPGAVVPIRDLVSDSGLGYPAGYRGTRYDPPPPSLTDRDHQLLRLAQQAAMSGEVEVVLDEHMVAALQSADPATLQVAADTELGFQVHATSRQAIDEGDFDLVVTAAFRAAGSTAGRFMHLLEPDDRRRAVAAYRSLPSTDPHALLVQLSSPPLLPGTEHLARAMPAMPAHMSLGEFPTPGLQDVCLDHLAVTGDAQRQQLVSLKHEQPVEFTAFNSVEFSNATQPLARLLCEISRARASTCRPFVWGAAAKLPFLPRIRYGRTVLCPARWNLTPTDVADSRAGWNTWNDTLTAWARRVRLPEAVLIGGDDRRIRLDLREDAHRHLLRAHLERYGHATLREAPDPQAFGWLDGHTHEIILPLAHTGRATWPPLSTPAADTPRLIRRSHGAMPGHATVLQAKLYSHPHRHNDILATALDERLRDDHERPQWWFLRYRDPDHHLRIRIPLPTPDAYGPAAQRVSDWADELRHAGLISHLVLDTYHPETGRFGPAETMTAAEAVFAADSRAAVAQLAAAQLGGNLQALTAASLVDLTIAFTGDTTEGTHWLTHHIRRRSTAPLDRTNRYEAVRLGNPAEGWAAIGSLPGGDRVIDAWSARRLALAMYRAHLALANEIEPTAVLASLLHLHHVRVFGLDQEREETTHRLARAAALSWIARNEGTHP